MREAFLLAALGIVATEPQAQTSKDAIPAAAGDVTVFSFMGDDTETPTSRTMINKSKCSQEGAILSCTEYLDATVAGRPMRWLTMKFNEQKLFMVNASFGDAAYDDVRAAFIEKYGPPARAETRKWQSKGGAVFDNAVLTWNFKGGRLDLESLGAQVGSGAFSFVSTANAPPPEKPKVDF
ncbi:hypothetical protein [Sphingomonas sp. ABOLF]|uniref:hypothetical protein n=1 Tax=Sphingomonas sp. ABOLF TaxID=1985879 RepID=UPI000F7E24F3|nr:hypothetical protein [Sphingomonas sp. ABOLF]